MKAIKYLLAALIAGTTAVSCDDMMDKGNDNLVYAQDFFPNNPSDTVTSVLGILNKLQAIAVRTNLLGEVRADLVSVNANATTDLKDLAALQADVTGDDDANIYNVPRDYYAVINNCNFFIARADSTAGNANRNEKYFEAEIAQVHSIRAWTYLQLVLAYGRVPLVTDPVLTKLQSDAQYPMVDLQAVCDYFIKDLQPFYGKKYPDYRNIGGDIDPKLCFFPTQVVMGDLYLYRACAAHSAADAKEAAKKYYDYIVWDLSGKKKLLTGSDRQKWSTEQLSADKYMAPSGSSSNSSTWGATNCSDVTKIPMDSAAADGFYNELRNLYNTTNNVDLREASIRPSESYKLLSRQQQYYDRDKEKNTVHVTADKFEQKDIEKGYLGDLRYQQNFSTRDQKYNSQEVEFQSIRKHNSQHVGIYRASQIYLRMAEALNYAGYPRFARAILTMGLNNTVIKNEVSRYYPADSAYFATFDFNTIDFLPYAENYSEEKNEYGVVLSVSPVLRSGENEVNMWGIHSRGCGLAFLDPDYCTLQIPDSTGYPYAKEQSLGSAPERSSYEDPSAPKKPKTVSKPSTWDKYGNTVVTAEEYAALNADEPWYVKLSSRNKEKAYEKYVSGDSIAKYNVYLTETLPAYEAEYNEYLAAVRTNDQLYSADSTVFAGRVADYLSDYRQWYKAAYTNPDLILREQKTIDEAILTEQALELVYEGNRFFDLMRRAMWYNDTNVMVSAVSQRDPQAGARLADKRNWFLHWKGQIGY